MLHSTRRDSLPRWPAHACCVAEPVHGGVARSTEAEARAAVRRAHGPGLDRRRESPHLRHSGRAQQAGEGRGGKMNTLPRAPCWHWGALVSSVQTYLMKTRGFFIDVVWECHGWRKAVHHFCLLIVGYILSIYRGVLNPLYRVVYSNKFTIIYSICSRH